MLFNFLPVPSNAQAWNKHSKILSTGIGLSRFYHIDDYYYGNDLHAHNWYAPTTIQFNLQAEFAIHKYFGLGFTTGFGGRKYPVDDRFPNEVNFPIGMITNFHFYQLIADRTKHSIHADKLDIYAGFNVGTGVATAVYANTTRTVPLTFIGLHTGIRYYVTKSVGLNAELGWGKSIVNAGLCFKL